MEEKERVLSDLRELRVKSEDLFRYLQSDDKDIKHEAWVTAEKLIRSGKLELQPLLCFPDHGTRYRVWNLIPDLPHVKREVIISGIPCFLELLQDKDVNVRRLSWYVTLPKLLSYVNLADVKMLTDYCREVATGEWKDLLDETCREIQD
ncbi:MULTISPECIES: hypothetical protein [Metallosphaera]|uniref:hypothetical protein n=1 Tax=Metallosphaera TaxID=41980 RepID=UPI001F058C2D|nr:hypothetical protein [Metallosphaera sedula]MCH1770380.1 hypothetical protein [Metallosphaera sedula]MCP6727786.1 hypothetical protein [Metallosphaera sedula]